MFTIKALFCTVTEATLFNDLEPGTSFVVTLTLSSSAVRSVTKKSEDKLEKSLTR